MNGLLCLYKPAGITSYDCIRHLKKLLPKKTKIGHAGTLDPFADGLLIIGIGSGTKELSSLLGTTKSYLVTAKLGELSDTLDLTGTILEKQDAPMEINFLACAQKLMPSYEQTPPVFSSVKFKGKALHRLARSEQLPQSELLEIAESRKKLCSILELSVLEQKHPFVTFSATVSKGTYIRSLALDIAKQAGTIASVYKLTRTQIGNFSIENAISLEKLTNSHDINEYFFKKMIDSSTNLR